MHGEAFFAPLKILSYIVLAAMLGSLLYSAWIWLSHAPQIGV
ncbi:MAG TPA: hypothetical protein VHK24_10040 [Steroidobacter sp.]|nr:hypothetical protein [Steroidobacter sp.]